MRPETTAAKLSELPVFDDGWVSSSPTPTHVLPATGLKFAPVTVTAAPALTRVGENPVMVGADCTKNTCVLVAVFVPTVMAMGPDVAVLGTCATRELTVEDTTVALVPLKLTIFELGVVLNPLPCRVTCVPPVPTVGSKALIVN
jgi:hypothetical protein